MDMDLTRASKIWATEGEENGEVKRARGRRRGEDLSVNSQQLLGCFLLQWGGTDGVANKSKTACSLDAVLGTSCHKICHFLGFSEVFCHQDVVTRSETVLFFCAFYRSPFYCLYMYSPK